MLPALLLFHPLDGWSCQIEYSDWLVNVFRQQGMSLDKRTGNYASQSECEQALRDAVDQSGDPYLANHMRCVDCTSPAAQPLSGYSVQGPEGTTSQDSELSKTGRDVQAVFDRNNQELLQSLKGGHVPASGLNLKIPVTPPVPGTGLTLKPASPTAPKASSLSDPARREQQHLDRARAEWLRNQQQLVRQTVAQDDEWRKEVLTSIRTKRVPSLVKRPKELDDLRPGDVLLIGPDQSAIAWTIKNLDPLYRALDYFAAGYVSAPELKQGLATHVLTFIRRVDGVALFLDHTQEGSRILNEKELLRKYNGRLAYIAKPQAKVDGRALWEAAREAALKSESDYGLFGDRLVCSERAAVVVAKATGTAMHREKHGFGIYGPIDITPADFFDEKHVGKYFLVSTYAILLQL